ncbi:MAG: hypothetical protein EP330_21465 [Deltaproteobacteria bacterium]|nr:MAG: hypothetical protein EP330_21465 [Deltaproteobacteria bacterium]
MRRTAQRWRVLATTTSLFGMRVRTESVRFLAGEAVMHGPMRLLHLTDTHLGASLRVHGAPAGWERAQDHRDAMEAALEPAFRGEVDLVVHSGDLFDRSSPPSDEAWWAWEVFSRLAKRVPVVVVTGNHERKGLQRHLPASLDNLHVVDRAQRLTVAGLNLGVVAYARTARAWSERAAQVCEGGVDLLVAHQAFDGAQVPGFTFTVGKQKDTIGAAHLPDGVTHVLSGHIHPRQVVRLGEVPVVFPGSAERTSFTERFETKGYAIWTREDGRWQWTFHDLASRPMVVVDREEDLENVREGDLVSVRAEPWEDFAGRAQAAGAIVVQKYTARERASIAEDDQIALPLGAVAYLPSVRAARGQK